MPDNWDFSQKPSRPRRGLTDTGPQMPLLTYLLTALSTVITVAYLQPGMVNSPLWEKLGQFGFQPGVWGMLTTIFVHGSWLHLLFDMIWLVQLGRILENTLPPLAYLGLVVAAALVGSGCEISVSGSTGIGMSGVVYAMFGLMWAGRSAFASWASVATPDNLRLFVLWGLFCVVGTVFHFLNIANGAHGGGFLLGLSLGYLFFTIRRHWVWAVPLVLLAGVTVFSAVRLA